LCKQSLFRRRGTSSSPLASRARPQWSPRSLCCALCCTGLARPVSGRSLSVIKRERHYEEGREAEQRAVAVARCWDQWWQVVETAALEPAASECATLGLGPEVTLELLRGLLRDAERLGDDTLANAVAVHQEQLLLVLAQQGGPLSTLAAPAPAASAHRGPDKTPPPDQQASSTEGPASSGVASEPRRRRAAATATGAAPEPATGETPSATGEETGGRRRRR
jgi:hypothetical protein